MGFYGSEFRNTENLDGESMLALRQTTEAEDHPL
jgi:hypothetical protein